jgi:spoIIIJ-associated protein
MDKLEIIKNVVTEMFQLAFGDGFSVEFTPISSSAIKIDIGGDNVSYLIGQRGKTLLAIQLLIRQMYINLSQDFTDEFKIIVDIGGYKSKKVEKIQEIARQAAQRAIELSKDVTLPRMNAFERHIVHQYINENFSNLQTSSVGQEPNRRVVLSIKYSQ